MGPGQPRVPPYLALLRAGVASAGVAPLPGGLLPHRFTLALSGGLVSVALSVLRGSPPGTPGVTRRPALRSPDFPPAFRQRPPGLPGSVSIYKGFRANDQAVIYCGPRNPRRKRKALTPGIYLLKRLRMARRRRVMITAPKTPSTTVSAVVQAEVLRGESWPKPGMSDLKL